jgi:hypothetical protein
MGLGEDHNNLATLITIAMNPLNYVSFQTTDACILQNAMVQDKNTPFQNRNASNLTRAPNFVI